MRTIENHEMPAIPGTAEIADAVEKVQDAQLRAFSLAGESWSMAFAGVGQGLATFFADRLRADFQLQQKMMFSTDLGEIRDAQQAFLREAVEAYAAETGKLWELTKAGARK